MYLPPPPWECKRSRLAGPILAGCIVILGAWPVPVWAEDRPSKNQAVRFVIASDKEPEVPRPEQELGEPLPADPGAVARRALEDIFAEPAPPSEPGPAPVGQLYRAIDEGDTQAVEALLLAGLDPDSHPPEPLGPDLLDRFRQDFLIYYVTRDSGLTPLMFAAGRGHRDIAALLLEHGAKRQARTQRHGTDALWMAGHAGHVRVEQLLLGVEPGSAADLTFVEIDLPSQTARLVRPDRTEETVPISSGKRRFATPTGEYVVTNKHRRWKSTIYGASMPFYLRLSSRDFGLHAGHLPGYPASHGCIRLRRGDAENFFQNIPIGTRVVIQ